MIRISAGLLKGMKLMTPDGQSTRPTTSKVRQACLSMLGDDLLDANILDLFCGSGAYGLEGLSMGAFSATFVDNCSKVKSCVENNLIEAHRRFHAQDLKIGPTRFINKDLMKSFSFEGQFNLIFSDPPYLLAPEWLATCSQNLAKITKKDATWLFEHGDSVSIDLIKKHTHPEWEIDKMKTYGIQHITILKKTPTLG